jgi:ribokinase
MFYCQPGRQVMVFYPFWRTIRIINLQEKKMNGHIVVVGSLNMDLVVRALHYPQPGETIFGTEFRTFPGGKGANQAVAAARLGGKVKLIGKVGIDAHGDALLKALASDKVDTTHVLRDPQTPTGVAVITLDSAGQNTIVVVVGANESLTPEDITIAEASFVGASLLLVQLETPLPAMSRAVELAKKYGARVILNPAPAHPLQPGLLDHIDYLIPNQIELSVLAGMIDRASAINFLRDQGIPSMIVTLGGEGVLIADDLGEAYLPAHTVEVIDTTAAGDAFIGAFAVALTEGASTLNAAQWGNAAGALAVTKAGAQPSLPTRDVLEYFLTNQ